MYSLKHFTILLIAVFLALGIGIAVGFTANSDEVLVEQQKKTIDRLEKDFNRIKEESRLKEQQLQEVKLRQAEEQKFLEQLYDQLFKERLKGKKLAIIETSKSKITENITHYLERTGAKIVYTVSLKQNSLNDELDSIVQVLAEENQEGFNSIKETGILEFSGMYDVPVDLFIIISNDKNSDAVSMANKFAEFKKTIALVQSSDVKHLDYKYIDNVIYIDDVDSILGKYRLISSILDILNMNDFSQ
ncbi:MAG TPA: copper transporter [Thermoanaerobacterales bacterium]|nr:copper transporter [Thermoanaerobacterales bacterium]